jgi:uncharacterized protein (UPF0261 family)
MAKTILVIGTLDTKAKELDYLRKRIEAEGVQSQRKAGRILVKLSDWIRSLP